MVGVDHGILEVDWVFYATRFNVKDNRAYGLRKWISNVLSQVHRNNGATLVVSYPQGAWNSRTKVMLIIRAR